ncbi:MAG: hypothetical protein WKG00_24815 [Polyangiaceae bacterium]
MSTTTHRAPPPWSLGGPSHATADYGLEIERTGPLAVATLRAVVAMPRDFATVRQSFRADRYRGRRVRFRATARTVDVVGRAWLWMRVDGERGDPPLAFDGMGGRGLDGNCDWGEHAVVLDVAPAARTVHFGFALQGTGALRVRGMGFEVVDDTVAVTDTPLADVPQNLALADLSG